MAAKRKSDSDWVSWVVIAVLFMVGLSLGKAAPRLLGLWVAQGRAQIE